MKKNLLALMLVVLACALATQWPRLANQRLSNELSLGLEKLWDKPGQAVELVSTPGGVDARVRAVLPADCTARQQQWNFQVLRFVSQRYGEPKLLRITLSQRDSGQSIEEQSSALSVQTPEETANQAHLELIRRQAQAWLDQNLGSGHGLALVDGTATLDSTPLFPDATQHHYLRARPEESEGKARPLEAESNVAPALTSTRFTTQLVLAVDGRVPEAEKKTQNSSELTAQLGLRSEGDQVRVVLLP